MKWAIERDGAGVMKKTIAFVLGFFVCAGGCTATKVQNVEKSSAGDFSAQTVAVLSIRQGSANLADCVRKSMHRANSNLRFIDPLEFRDDLFPWFEPGTAPRKTDNLALLLHRPLVREKIAQLGLRYVISIDGATTAQDWDHHIEGGGGYGSFAWFGYGKKACRTYIDVTIWDLEEPASSGDLSGERSGASYYLCCIIPFFYIPSTTESHACKEMGEELVQFLAEHSVNE
jgi:hypothetical protein